MARKLDGGGSPSDGHATTTRNDADDDGERSLLARRDYVKLGMAAVATTAGLSATAAADNHDLEREGITFEHRFDAVADLGMDPAGETHIGGALADVPENSLIQFPEGTYLIDASIELTDPGSIGLETTEGATLVGGADLSGHALDIRGADGIYYAGFVHDESRSPVHHHWQADERIEVHDVSVDDGVTLSSASESTFSTASEPQSYETIVLEPGEQRVHELQDGERFENVLIDQTAEGAMFVIHVASDADNWVLRNVGWKGVAPSGGDREHTFLINVRGNGLIENIFLDQRNHHGSGRGSDVGAIWTYSDSHHGHIDCRHNFIAGCGNNGSYDSGDGFSHRASTGTVGHQYSYHRDNTPSNFRPGKPGSFVRNCVSIANDPDATRGGYPANGSQLTRAVWGWHNEGMEVRDCAIWWDPDDCQPSSPFWATHRGSDSEGDRCELNVIDCDINASWDGSLAHENSSRSTVDIQNLGNDPSVSVLGEGVPLSPEMAARGERALPPEVGTAPGAGHGESEGSEPVLDDPITWSYDDADGVHTAFPHELVIEHAGDDQRVTYEVEFDGDVEVGEWEYNATVEGHLATGALGPSRGLDNLYFDGAITRFDVDHPEAVTCYLADAQSREIVEEIDPAVYPPEETPDDGGSGEPDDGGSDDPVSEFVYTAADGVHTDLPRELVLEHQGDGERVTYEVEFDGDVEVGEWEYNASVDGTLATGALGPSRGLDNLYFDGEITRFEGEHLEDIRLLVADARSRTVLGEFDPATFPEEANPYCYAFATGVHTDLPLELVIEHVDPGERVEYELEIAGEVETGECEYPPSVDGTVVSGGLGPSRGMDNVYFDGEITHFEGTNLDRVRLYLADAQTRTVIEEIDPEEFAAGDGPSTSLRIVGEGTSATYDFTVSGSLEADPEAEFDASDNISGRNAEGTVTDGEHAYLFDGELMDLQIDGDAMILVDGEPLEYGSTDGSRVRIDGGRSRTVAGYQLEVAGSLARAADDGAGTNGAWDHLEDHLVEDGVTGIVHTGVDTFRYDGDIVTLQVEGTADVTFESAD